jgi:hypothetical protein
MPIEEVKLRRFDGALGQALDSIQRNLNRVISNINSPGKKPGTMVGPWFKNTIPAGATEDLQIVNAVATEWFTAHRSGSIVGYSFSLSDDAAGSDLTININKNGDTIHTAVIKTSDDYPEALKTVPPGVLRFQEGDDLTIEYVTDGSWSATSEDLICWLELAF